MPGFEEAKAALEKAVKRVFPQARPGTQWQGVTNWAAPRPEGAPVATEGGTYDPKVTVIGIADRKAGPVVYFLDPGDYFALETHRALLEGAGLKVGRGCIYHTKKGPLPVAALEELFRLTKARDESGAKPAAKKATKTTAKKAPAKEAARKAAKKAAKKAPAKRAAKKAGVKARRGPAKRRPSSSRA